MMARRDQGFTLMEVVVTAAFMGIVVLALNSLFVFVGQINRAANNYSIASEAAQKLIEQYRNLPYSSITTGTSDVTASALGPYPSLLTPRSATVTVTQVDPNGLKQILVAISYKDRTGVKNVQLETVVSYKGLNR